MERIELSIGTVKIKPLTNKIHNRALAYATLSFKTKDGSDSATNTNAYLNYVERKMAKIHFWRWGNMTIKDGDKLREKIMEMLKEDGILKEEKPKYIDTDKPNLTKELHEKDLEWFNSVGQKQKGMIK